jgi:hypothetical protein
MSVGSRRRRALAPAVLSVVMACLVLAACGDDGQDPDPAPASIPDDWTVVDDEAISQTFRFPAEHERVTQVVQLPDGARSELRLYSHPMVIGDADAELLVSVLPLDPDTVDLNATPAGAAEAVGGALVDVRPVDTAGFPGRDIEVALSRDGAEWLVLQRIVLTDTALVQLQVNGPAAERDELVTLHDQLVAGFG